MKAHKDSEEALQRCKIHLMKIYPFLAFIAFQLKHVFSDIVPTAGINSTHVYYNEDFFMKLSHEMRLFLMAHELQHFALMHKFRVGNRDKELWNIAGDYVINPMLVKRGMVMPMIGLKVIGLYDEKYIGMPSEQVYDLLVEEGKKYETDTENLLDIIYNEENEEVCRQNVKKIISRAIALCGESQSENRNNIGSHNEDIPDEILRVIDQLNNPVLKWDRILDKYLDKINRPISSWKRPNKRYLPIYLPTYIRSKINNMIENTVIAIDTSVSINNDQIISMISEVQSLLKKYDLREFTIIDCDHKINAIYKINNKINLEELVFTGGGGTDFKPVESYCDKNKVKLLIYFTDLEIWGDCDITEKKPYDIIWINHGMRGMKGKIGKTIYFPS